jgi:hypothetical protein
VEGLLMTFDTADKEAHAQAKQEIGHDGTEINAHFTLVQLNESVLTISRATAVILLVAFLM